VGPEELLLIADLRYRRFPPRLPEQPIFYPVVNEEHAVKIARDWNVPASGAGFVTRFELDEFNKHIRGEIEVVASFGEASPADAPASEG
jgi:hypothetical protein